MYRSDLSLAEWMRGLGLPTVYMDSVQRLIPWLILLLNLTLILRLICGLVSWRVTQNRKQKGGFWWGFFLGTTGIIVAALRPKE